MLIQTYPHLQLPWLLYLLLINMCHVTKDKHVDCVQEKEYFNINDFVLNGGRTKNIVNSYFACYEI